MPLYCSATLDGPSYDVQTITPEARLNVPGSRHVILQEFDRRVAAARASLAKATDAEMMAPWTLKSGDQVIFTLPRVSALRSFVMNHLIHHRGQLSVYLRLKDVPVPSIYGPTADEQ
jgi:uncharacterized damage-inducible protein DinB